MSDGPAARHRRRPGTPGAPTVAGSQPATTRAAAEALTDKPPVVPGAWPAWTPARPATSAAA